MLAPGTARRRALDDALAELEAGLDRPSPDWKIRYALMLGLERVLSERPPRLKSGTELRRHQIDALAGMLTELIAANQKAANGNGNGHAKLEEVEELEDEEDDFEVDGEAELPPAPEEDPGAARRYRFRHPTASGKTIAAAGFVEAARTEGVLILTHRRLLVSQFNRELTAEGYGDRLKPAVDKGKKPPRPDLITVQTYAWFARHVNDLEKSAYQLVICDEAHTALGEKTSAAIRSYTEPVYIGMTATEQLIAKQVSDVFPASVDDLPLQDAARRGLIAPATLPPRPARGGDQLGADRRRRLRGARAGRGPRPPGAEPGGREPLPRPLRLDAGHRLRSRRRARLQPRARVPRRRPEGRGGQRPNAAGQARGDPRRLRARRDRHPHQRDAARRGLELAPRDGLHAPRADREPPRLPAADRPDHADASTEGGRRRRRLHAEGSDAQRARRLAAQPPRRRLLPRGRTRDARASPAAAAARPPQALAGAVARPGDAGRQAPTQRDRARVAAGRPALSRRGRAALLGPDRRPPGAVRGACRLREEADRRARQPRAAWSSSCSPARRRTPTAAFG